MVLAVAEDGAETTAKDCSAGHAAHAVGGDTVAGNRSTATSYDRQTHVSADNFSSL